MLMNELDKAGNKVIYRLWEQLVKVCWVALFVIVWASILTVLIEQPLNWEAASSNSTASRPIATHGSVLDRVVHCITLYGYGQCSNLQLAAS